MEKMEKTLVSVKFKGFTLKLLRSDLDKKSYRFGLEKKFPGILKRIDQERNPKKVFFLK